VRTQHVRVKWMTGELQCHYTPNLDQGEANPPSASLTCLESQPRRSLYAARELLTATTSAFSPCVTLASVGACTLKVRQQSTDSGLHHVVHYQHQSRGWALSIHTLTGNGVPRVLT
jgi:hypothetical protein